MQTAPAIVANFIRANAIDIKELHAWFQDGGHSDDAADIHDARYLDLLGQVVEERDDQAAFEATPPATLPRIFNKHIPTPGTSAYWIAQREAVALFAAWKTAEGEPIEVLNALRAIASHGFASGMMAAHGHRPRMVRRWIEYLEANAAPRSDGGEDCDAYLDDAETMADRMGDATDPIHDDYYEAQCEAFEREHDRAKTVLHAADH